MTMWWARLRNEFFVVPITNSRHFLAALLQLMHVILDRHDCRGPWLALTSKSRNLGDVWTCEDNDSRGSPRMFSPCSRLRGYIKRSRRRVRTSTLFVHVNADKVSANFVNRNN